MLWGEETTDNTVLGNVIGADATGTEDLGNVDGVGIGGGVTRNVIGPDNLIAYNKESGFLVDGPDTLGNTITRNQIHHFDIAHECFGYRNVELSYLSCFSNELLI